MERVRWGILGTGRIASVFATGLRELPDAELVAVGSRTAARAAEFADGFAIPRRHASDVDLANDPDIDIVYVASPHPFHHAHARRCLAAGKAVLCEKPLTINADQARDLVAIARERNLFLMEAMWTRFLPAVRRLRELIAAGAIGEVRLLTADFGFRKEYDPGHRLYDPALGGGALLDVGVYLVSLASMLFGAPSRIASIPTMSASGVDAVSALLLGYPNGGVAQLTAAISLATPQEATIVGTAGSITLHPLWWKVSRLTVRGASGDAETLDLPFAGNGYHEEAAEAMRCLRAGATESPIMPLDESVSIIATLDQVRADWGLRYPMEPK